MNGMDIIMFFWSILFSIIGLFVVILKKKGLIKSSIHIETTSFLFLKKTHVRGMSGGIFTFSGAFAGFVVLCKYSALWAFLYAGIVAAIYIFIQIIYYKKKKTDK